MNMPESLFFAYWTSPVTKRDYTGVGNSAEAARGSVWETIEMFTPRPIRSDIQVAEYRRVGK